MLKLWLILAATVLFVIGLFLADILEDRKRSVRILYRKPILEDWGSMSELPIGYVEPNERLKVLRLRNAKDHVSIQVQREDGTEGWLILDRDIELSPAL